MILRGLGANPIAILPQAGANGPGCYNPTYPVSSNGWCFDNVSDWTLYGNLPQYQSTASVSPVAAQQIALANAQVMNVPVATKVIVAGGGPGMYQAASSGLAPGVTVGPSGVTVNSAPVTGTLPTISHPAGTTSTPSSNTIWILAALGVGAYLFFKGGF